MNTFKNGLKLGGSLIIAAVIGIFLTISINVICSALFTKEIGYNAYVYENETATKAKYEYQYLYTDEDGDGKDDKTDTKKKEYEDNGYIVTTQKVRSTLTGKDKAIFLIVTQLLSMCMVVAFASDSVYKRGFKDSNLVKIGQAKKDILKGLKIGLIGNIPFFALALFMVVLAMGVAPGFKTVWYAFLNGHFYSFTMWISQGAESLADLSVTQFVLIFAVQFIAPVISCIAYILGFKEINIFEKIVYKKEVK